MPKVKLVDTTLRDGEQAPGLAFSLKTKLLLASQMDQAGIYQLEAGCPVMGPSEEKTISAVKEVCPKALISSWNRIRREDVLASLRTPVDLIHLCLPVTKAHLTKKLGLLWPELIDNLSQCLDLINNSPNPPAISVGLEDASRATLAELDRAAESLLNLGIRRVRLSDTVGILTPLKTRQMVGFLVKYGFQTEFHGHNDLGLAEANSLAAVFGGAQFLDTTLAGIGERAGNCGLARLVSMADREVDVGVSLQKARALEDLLPGLEARRSYMLDLIKENDLRIFSSGAHKFY
jgi:homocitrate synthase NifV